MPGPGQEEYRIHLDSGVMHRFAVGDTKTAEGWDVVAPSGGATGNWLAVLEPDQGDDLGNANVTITVGQKRWRVLPAATLTGNKTITLGTTNARDGHTIEITRLDTTAYTLAIVNGGSGGGTLMTMAASERTFCKAYFDGTDWLLREGHVIPA